YPWAWTEGGAPNEAQLATLGRKFGYFNGYSVCQPSQCLYSATGSTDDWSYGVLGVASFTFEMGTTFFQSCSSYESTIAPNNLPAILYAFIPDLQPYNQFKFQGDQLTTGGIHYDWQYRNFNLFGEAAMDEDGGKAFISGLLISIDPRIDLAMIYRNYGKDFHSLYANAFAESSTTDNESGLYSGIILRPVKGWTISAYLDLFEKPWLDFGIDAPSNGIEMLAQVTYKPNKILEIYGRWKDESKQQNSTLNDEPLDYIVGVRKQNLRFNLSYKASASFSLHSRAEWVFFKEEKISAQHGFLAYQDIIYRKLGSPLQLTGRVCLFDADTYDARIYAYENDVLYAYSIPAFSNQGMRFYAIARYTITRGIDVWVRYAQTYYTNIDVIGSGLDEINGNTKSEVKAEVRFKF
ncbi:MAG: hypothetical protein ABIO98_01210, partial [Chitinophagales bacterium]